jgi:hypothetical protein
MIGVIWNCQGLGRKGKFEFLKELIREEKVDFIGIQETMRISFNKNWLDALSGNRNFVWMISSSVGKSGGLLVGFNMTILMFS